MKIALAQIETRVGAIAPNERRIVQAAREARTRGADLVLFPELAVTGYPPRDLLFREDFVREACRSTLRIAEAVPEIKIVLGTIEPGKRKLRNVAAFLHGGEILASRAKTNLPSYSVFFEERWFEAGCLNSTLEQMGVVLCEDLWEERYEKKPARDLVAEGARFLLALNASPYRTGIQDERLRRARKPGIPIAYVNAVGAEDELVFDGGSFALDGRGRLVASLPRFKEALEVVDLETAPPCPPLESREEDEIFSALALGIRSFARRNGCEQAVLGLSGGVDSALVACLATEALGKENVRAVSIPSRFNDPASLESARELAGALGIHFEAISLEPLLLAAERSLDLSGKTTHENAQARLRMIVLMADVNRSGGLLLNTSNKTELALGYGTLWGDLAGDLAPIGDLTKTQVYALAERQREIPRFMIERAPSAELAYDQRDPFDYPSVAPLVERIVRGEHVPGAEEWERRVRSAEHKRRLAPIVLKVSEVAFGSGRLVPVTQG